MPKHAPSYFDHVYGRPPWRNPAVADQTSVSVSEGITVVEHPYTWETWQMFRKAFAAAGSKGLSLEVTK